MKGANARQLALGLLFVGVALLLALAVDTLWVRYAGSVTALAIGLSLLRRAFRAE